ncbi:MAG: hypothetical protein C0602_00130 [Denitrovibrio sp.]|nr:MAG: hypothetical protein C0602_00130 [Denitrovibrio sp.]
MKLRFVYGILPVLIFAIKRNIHMDAMTKWFIIPYIIIEDEDYNNKDLLVHELTHAKQMYKGLVLFYFIRRWASHNFILKCEREAYKAQGLSDKDISMKLLKY